MGSSHFLNVFLYIFFILAHQSGARARAKARVHQLFIGYCSHTYTA